MEEVVAEAHPCDEALERAQRKWSPEQWAEWEKKQAAKERSTPQWLPAAIRALALFLDTDNAAMFSNEGRGKRGMDSAVLTGNRGVW